MASIYWIEDELELLKRPIQQLEKRNHVVVRLADAQAATDSLDRMKKERGVVVLDLYIPKGDGGLMQEVQNGPEVGLRLLAIIQQAIGAELPIVILSGNLTVETLGQLEDTHHVVRDHIFRKPLERCDEFISVVDGLARSSSSVGSGER